jgi:hypothetical protein
MENNNQAPWSNGHVTSYVCKGKSSRIESVQDLIQSNNPEDTKGATNTATTHMNMKHEDADDIDRITNGCQWVCEN